jgi:hypothetical protein
LEKGPRDGSWAPPCGMKLGPHGGPSFPPRGFSH